MVKVLIRMMKVLILKKKEGSWRSWLRFRPRRRKSNQKRLQKLHQEDQLFILKVESKDLELKCLLPKRTRAKEEKYMLLGKVKKMWKNKIGLKHSAPPQENYSIHKMPIRNRNQPKEEEQVLMNGSTKKTNSWTWSECMTI